MCFVKGLANYINMSLLDISFQGSQVRRILWERVKFDVYMFLYVSLEAK